MMRLTATSIPEPQWSKVVHREIPTLYTSFFSGTRPLTSQAFTDILGEENVGIHHYLNIFGDIHFDGVDMAAISAAVEKRNKKEPQFAISLAKHAYAEGDKLLQLAKTTALVGEEDWEKAWKKFADAMERYQMFIMTPLSLERWLQNEVQTVLNKYKVKDDTIFRFLTAAEKPNINFEELLSFLCIVEQTQQKKDVEALLEQHIQTYGWIGGRFGYGAAWTKDDLRERVNKALVNFNPEQKNQLESQHKEIKHKSAMVMDRYGFTDGERRIVAQAKEYAHMRTYRSDTIYHAFYNIHPFLERVGGKFGLNLAQTLELTAEELEDIAVNQPDKHVLEERREQFIFYVNRYKNIQKVLSGSIAKEQHGEFETMVGGVEVEAATGLKGQTATSGAARGRVNIIASQKEFNKFNDGDVLVTSMTTPDFVPLMQRAAAIVTDEGGILCHAAIVSRELNKPCIIGTKIATHILKSGDEVEVDADSGVVRILKKISPVMIAHNRAMLDVVS